MGAVIELVDVEKWTCRVAVNVDIFVANRKHCKSLVDRHQTCISTQNNVRICIFFMPKMKSSKRLEIFYVVRTGINDKMK